MPRTVHLSLSAVLMGASLGVLRHVRARAAGRPPRNDHPDDETSWVDHITGVLGEIVVATDLKAFTWMPAVDPDKHCGDVNGWEVRATAHKEGHLIVNFRDQPQLHPERRYVLVVGLDQGFALWRIAGWLRAPEVCRWRGEIKGRACYKVAQDVLHSWPVEVGGDSDGRDPTGTFRLLE